jgi:Phage integrase family
MAMKNRSRSATENVGEPLEIGDTARLPALPGAPGNVDHLRFRRRIDLRERINPDGRKILVPLRFIGRQQSDAEENAVAGRFENTCVPDFRRLCSRRDASVWIIPANRMKMRRPHRVPLALQAITILKELRTLTGRYELLFPGVRSPSRPLSENTLNAALRRLGYAKDDMSSHGFRAAASSLLNECGKWNADAIEAQLAHVEANGVRKVYARAEYWAERVEMMAYWADRLDELRRGGIVAPLRA